MCSLPAATRRDFCGCPECRFGNDRSVALSQTVARVPVFKLKYLGADITNDIRDLTTSITFTDKLEGESDELEICLDNGDLRWMDAWLPKEGDVAELRMGYKEEALLGPVTFEIDEPEYSGTPDTLRLRGMATPITKSLRQKNTVAYENTTLKAIAQQIAEKHGLELVGNVPEIKLERVTQRDQSDLEFLRKTAIEYGLIFKIESAKKLVFYNESELENAPSTLTLKRQQLSNYRIRKGAVGTYKGVEFNYLDPKTGEYIKSTFDAEGKELTTQTDGKSEVASGDVLKVRERFENREQGEVKAKEALRRANRGSVEGSFDIEGNVQLAAGINISLEGFKKLSGKYQITQVRHELTRSRGYKSSVEIKGLELESDSSSQA